MPALIEKLLVRIEADSQQLQAELAKAGQSTRAFSTQTQAATAAGAGLGQRYAGAAVTISNAASSMARSGKIAGAGLNTIVNQASQMAFFFGPQGALVGAVGIALVSIVSLFQRAAEENKKFLEEFRKDLDTLQNAGDFTGLVERLRVLEQGTAAKNFTDGIKGLRQELAQLDEDVKGPLTSIGKDGQLIDPLGTVAANVKKRREEVVAELSKLETQFGEIQKRITTGAVPVARRETPAIRVNATSPQASIEATKRQAEELQKQQAVVRDLVQGFDDLFAKAASGALSLTDFDARLRELGDALTDRLPNAAKDVGTQFEILQRKAVAVRSELTKLVTDRTQREFEQLYASLTPTVVDDLRLRLKLLREELTAKNFTSDQIDQIERLETAIADVAIGAERTRDKIAEITTAAISPFDAQLQLQDLITQAQQSLRELSTSDDFLTGADDAKIRVEGLKQQIDILTAALEGLGGKGATVLTGTVSGTQQFASALQDVTNIAAGISTTLLGVDSDMTRLIQGSLQLANGFAQVAAAAEKAGGISQLFSGAGLAAALPGLGAIVAGVGVLFSQRQESPEIKAFKASIVENTKRLEDLRAGIVDLTLSVGGQKSASIRDVALFGDRRKQFTVGNVDVFGTARRVDDVLADLRKAGVSLDDLRRAARDFGIELSDTPAIAQLKQLQQAIAEFSLKALTDSLDGQLRLLELKIRIDPNAFSGIDGIVAKLDLLTGKSGKGGIPAIAQALEGLDPKAPDFAQQAITRLKILFESVGALGLEDFGDIDPAELPEILAGLIEALQGTIPAARSAGDLFSSVMDVVATQLEFGTIDATERLKKTFDAIADLFPDLAAKLDLTSLESVQQSIGALIEGFAADGELSEAERAQIEALRALLAAYKATQAATIEYSDALAVLDDAFAIFKTGAIERFRRIGEELGKAFPDLGELLQGIDPSTAAGRAELERRAQELFSRLAADGVTAEEQKVIDAIRRILGASGAIADEETVEAERVAREAADRRRRVLREAETRISALDIEDDVEQFKIRVQALQDALPGLSDVLGDLDLSTQEGREAFNKLVEDLLISPERLDAVAELLGIPLEELITLLAGLEDGFDTLGASVETLSQRVASALGELDFTLALEGVTDPLQRLTRTVQTLGDAIPEIDQALRGLDLTTAAGRKAAETALVALGKSSTDATVRDAVLRLLDQIRGIPTDETGLVPAARTPASSAQQSFTTSVAAITEATANRLADLFYRNVVATESMERQLSALLGGLLGAPPTIPIPSLGSFGARAGAGTIIQLSVPVNFYGPVSTADATDLASIVQSKLYDAIQQTLAADLQQAFQRRGDSQLIS